MNSIPMHDHYVEVCRRCDRVIRSCNRCPARFKDTARKIRKGECEKCASIPKVEGVL